MTFRGLIAGIAVVVGLALLWPAASNAQQVPPIAGPATAPDGTVALPEPVGRDLTPKLTREDVGTFLDGFMPFALARADIAGAVVTVVKDGEILVNRGYGLADVAAGEPVDPRTTLFRPGSITKLITWIAVMQQVEQGRLDLDTDINRYLDFQIPETFAQPITLRHLMTHTAGFEEAVRGLISTAVEAPPNLGDELKRWIPARIFPPGQVPAYSNYGTGLAAYIVERVTGEDFVDYAERHILAPLGMVDSTLRQPLPERLKSQMSRGYLVASEPPHGFEVVSVAPAGSLSAPAQDMARFMIALLQGGEIDGNRILRPETLEAMTSPVNRPIPGLLAMGLGFYEQSRNGVRAWGHGGDTIAFHSNLHLFLDHGVGLYISMNSGGREGASGLIRAALFEQFTDRYLPVRSAPRRPTTETAAAHALEAAGSYLSSRRSESNILKLGTIVGQADLVPFPDGTIAFTMFRDASGLPKRWREVEPDVWQEVGGTNKLVMVRDGQGRVVEIGAEDLPPIMSFRPAPAAQSKAWNLPLLGVTLLILTLTVVLWPASALVRRRFKQPLGRTGASLWRYRAVRAGALLNLVFLGGMALTLALGTIPVIEGRLDATLRLLQLAGVLGLLATIAAGWEAWLALSTRGTGAWCRIRSIAIFLAFLAVGWFAVGFNMLTFSLSY